MKKIVQLILCMVILVSCDSKNKNVPIYPDSNGRMNHLLLVVENSQWRDTIGKKLREIIGTPIEGLPQEENQFDISQVPLKSFGSMLKSSRNVLIIELGDENTFESKENVYAKPQLIVRVKGVSEAAILETLELYKKELIRVFKSTDLKNLQYEHRKKAHSKGAFKTLDNLGIELTIPKFFNLVDDTGEFLWLRQHLSGGIAQGDGSSNILVYSVPIPPSGSKVIESIVNIRDTIGKRYIPGRKENMFMITEKAFSPLVKKIKLDGKKTFKTLGKWEVLNDFMAGPFVNYVVEDLENNRWIVIEGFTYAPSVDKRDYMFELDAVLRTVHVNSNK